MKDIIITGKALKRELFILLGCFVIAFGVNIYAVIHYSRPAVELVSQIGFVLVTAACLYVLLWMLRLIVLLIAYVVKKIAKK